MRGAAVILCFLLLILFNRFPCLDDIHDPATIDDLDGTSASSLLFSTGKRTAFPSRRPFPPTTFRQNTTFDSSPLAAASPRTARDLPRTVCPRAAPRRTPTFCVLRGL